MATNRKLTEDLLKRLNVSQPRLSQKVKKMKEDHGPMSTADATYVIAQQEGLDLTKYLTSRACDRIRGLVPRSVAAGQVSKGKTGKKKPAVRFLRLNIAGSFPDVDALLSVAVARDAQKMTDLYPVYYVLENSLRVVIRRILENKHGKQWWDTKAHPDVRKKVVGRKKKEDKTPWHGKRGQHEIFYSDFGDLRAIIERNWDDFKDLFPGRDWVTQKFGELEHPRNVMAHHNPVNDTDLKRIEVIFSDWINLLKDRRSLIP